MGSVASSVFTSHLHAATAHLAGGYSHAASSLGAALAAARHTPGPAGQALAHAAQHAFITGSDTAVLAAIGAALLGALAAIAFLPARAARTASPSVTTAPSAMTAEPAPAGRLPVTAGRPA
jgi:hypothetical protein